MSVATIGPVFFGRRIPALYVEGPLPGSNQTSSERNSEKKEYTKSTTVDHLVDNSLPAVYEMLWGTCFAQIKHRKKLADHEGITADTRPREKDST